MGDLDEIGLQTQPNWAGDKTDDTDSETKPSQPQERCYPSRGQECRPAVAMGEKKNKTHRFSMSVLLTLASLRSQETIISIMLIN